MNISTADRDTIRALAEELAEIALLPVQGEKAELWKRLNGLNAVRPMVHMYQLPWGEIEAADPEPLRAVCEDPSLRSLETDLRRKIYQWHHFPGDMVVEPDFFIGPITRGDDLGIVTQEQQLAQADTDRKIGNQIRSHHFEPQIRDESDIEKIKIPKIEYDREATEERVALLGDLFGGALKIGVGIPSVNIAPWDVVVTWTGVQEILMDLALRPEYVHALMDRLTTAFEARMDQYEQLNLLRLNNGPEIVGQGGLGYTDELPGENFDPDHVTYANQWGGGMAQIFSEVSPDMHREFALAYEVRCLKHYALTYYGCCEPLHLKVDLVREMLPSVRKISMSPMADDDIGAETIGTTLVYSAKPNPANLATDTWRPELVRNELGTILEKTAGRGCHVELILKDVSTIRSEPQRLVEWSQIALELAEKYSG